MKSVRLSNFPHSPELCSFCFQMQGTFVCPHCVVSFSFCSQRVCPGARENVAGNCFVAINLDMHLFGFKFCFVTELKSWAIPLMSCSRVYSEFGFCLFAATFLWPSKIQLPARSLGRSGWETPCSAAGLGCLWIVYLVFGLSSPSQFCTKQGTLSFHTLKKEKNYTRSFLCWWQLWSV